MVLDELLNAIAVAPEGDGVVLYGGMLLRALGMSRAVDGIDLYAGEATPDAVAARLAAIVAGDPAGWGKPTVRRDGDVVIVDIPGTSGRATVRIAPTPPLEPTAGWVEVWGGTPVLGVRPETEAAAALLAGRADDLAWLCADRLLDGEGVADQLLAWGQSLPASTVAAAPGGRWRDRLVARLTAAGRAPR